MEKKIPTKVVIVANKVLNVVMEMGGGVMNESDWDYLLDDLFGFDEADEEVVDEDDLRWGLAVPEGWKNRRR